MSGAANFGSGSSVGSGARYSQAILGQMLRPTEMDLCDDALEADCRFDFPKSGVCLWNRWNAN